MSRFVAHISSTKSSLLSLFLHTNVWIQGLNDQITLCDELGMRMCWPEALQTDAGPRSRHDRQTGSLKGILPGHSQVRIKTRITVIWAQKQNTGSTGKLKWKAAGKKAKHGAPPTGQQRGEHTAINTRLGWLSSDRWDQSWLSRYCN